MSTTSVLSTLASTAISASVMRHVNAGLSFTALDISRAVQNGDGSNDPVKVPHSSLKEAVHQLYFGGDMGSQYTRTLITVDNKGNQAYLYHLDSVDTTNYDPTKVQPLPTSALGGGITGNSGNSENSGNTGNTVSPTAASQVLGVIGNPLVVVTAPKNATKSKATTPRTPTTTLSTKPLTSRNAMADGRLRIPVKAVVAAGLTRGDKAHLSVENGEAEIFAVASSNRKTKVVTVDQYDNILFNVGKDNGGKTYDIYVTLGLIKVVPA